MIKFFDFFQKKNKKYGTLHEFACHPCALRNAIVSVGVLKLPVLTLGDRRITDVDATSPRRRLTLKRCRSVGDWRNVRTKVSNANATNRLVRIGNFRNPSGPIRRLLLGGVVVSSEKYFNGGSRFKFAFARNTGLIASISTGDTSTER